MILVKVFSGSQETKPVFKVMDSADIKIQLSLDEGGLQTVRLPNSTADGENVNGIIKTGPKKGKTTTYIKNK